MLSTPGRLTRLILSLLLFLSAVPATTPSLPAQQQPYLLPQTLSSEVIEIRAETFGLPLAQDETARQYTKASVFLQKGDSLHFSVSLPAGAQYTLWFDAAASPSASTAPEGQVQVDGKFPVSDLRRVRFPLFYHNTSNTFPKDRYGNDALSRQQRLTRWTKTPARDATLRQPYPLRLNLNGGEHRFDFTLTNGALYLGSIYLEPFSPYPPYASYLNSWTDTAQHPQPAPVAAGFSLTLEAEFPTYKNDTSVRPTSHRGLTVTPYDTYKLLLNTLGGESWDKEGSAVYYEFSVPADGLYAVTFRALQNTRSNFTVFRRITVNDKVPFEELNAFPFPYSADWVDVPLGAETPYLLYLHKGVNTLGLEVTASPYLPAIETIQQALLDINALALEIRKLTGNQRDPYKEWVISDYIPDIETRLNFLAQRLSDDKDNLRAIIGNDASPEILTYQMAIDNLRFLAADVDKIPLYMKRLSEGSGSAAQLLGSLLLQLQSQPLALDKITIHSPDLVVQTPPVSFSHSLWEGFKRFIHSFQPDPYQSIGAEEGELEVWVNRPRQYVDLLQVMCDETFTPKSGIRVKFSIMPDESKLILANAAGIQPDVALGVSTDKPYELAIRNALYDLRSFEDFDAFIRIYSPGALLSYIINDSVYAIPETQDFWVTYYRKDILDSLGIPVPRTWNEVIQILPELQRYGMNYNTPLSSGAGLKGYLLTAPYLFNYGAKLYSDDGFSTGLQSEEAIAAIKFMAESFTIYGMPLTTSSFYESFRYGTLPIGVSNFETYIKLMTAAPEIEGQWAIDLYPATVLPDGTQNRYTTGSAQASIMFKNTDQPQEAWQFLKWWMSTDTQVDFQERLLLNYGKEYLWNSANLEAFSRLAIPEEHRAIILEEWQWLQEPVKLPGSYMQERELSNVWNRIVFDGANPRVALDRSIIIINREITRKMEEFGYLENGRRVKEFKIPTIETVREWMENAR
jgi:ABC-type glycerol-3-phosphate transport system substrate-binding protein